MHGERLAPVGVYAWRETSPSRCVCMERDYDTARGQTIAKPLYSHVQHTAVALVICLTMQAHPKMITKFMRHKVPII